MTWDSIVEEKEKHIVPLNLNIDLKRLTQLFGRSLYIKYFIKDAEIKRRSVLEQGAAHDDEGYGGGGVDHEDMGIDMNNNQMIGFEDA